MIYNNSDLDFFASFLHDNRRDFASQQIVYRYMIYDLRRKRARAGCFFYLKELRKYTIYLPLHVDTDIKRDGFLYFGL